jgi:predicted ABC-type ATPase
MGYAKKIEAWKKQHYEVIIFYLQIPTVEFAIERVNFRVFQGGQPVVVDEPEE